VSVLSIEKEKRFFSLSLSSPQSAFCLFSTDFAMKISRFYSFRAY